MANPVWLITGASNGFGLALARIALTARHRVIGSVRNKHASADAVREIVDKGGHVIELDITEPQTSVVMKIRAAEAIYGQIDILLNNAGYSIIGGIEQFSEDEVLRQYQTNVYGPLFTTQGVLPGMRTRRSGFIVNVSSVGGQDSHAAGGLYGATKFALEGMSESLYYEVKEFGIGVLIVEPGLFRTNFLHALQTPKAMLPEGYKGSVVEKTLGLFSGMTGRQPGDPDKAVRRLFEVITGEGSGGKLRGKVLRLPIGMDAVDRIDKKARTVLADVAEARKLEEEASTAFERAITQDD